MTDKQIPGRSPRTSTDSQVRAVAAPHMPFNRWNCHNRLNIAANTRVWTFDHCIYFFTSVEHLAKIVQSHQSIWPWGQCHLYLVIKSTQMLVRRTYRWREVLHCNVFFIFDLLGGSIDRCRSSLFVFTVVMSSDDPHCDVLAQPESRRYLLLVWFCQDWASPVHNAFWCQYHPRPRVIKTPEWYYFTSQDGRHEALSRQIIITRARISPAARCVAASRLPSAVRYLSEHACI